MIFPENALDSVAAREAIRIIDRLRDAGFVAVLAGGCVRDALLGRMPKDFDVATDATPDSVQQVFGRRHTVAFGASFGVIGVLPPLGVASDELSGAPTEVATFRADGNYSDGRRPDHVTYGNAEADAARRDFTINGLFYDPAAGEILDYVDGLADLRAMHLRTIGDADRRFDEDKLRMLRAVRFVTTLGLSVEPSTLAAIRLHAGTLALVSGERIGAEMRRVVAHPAVATGLQLLLDTGLHAQVWPQIESLAFSRLRTDYQRIAGSEMASGMTFESGLATILTLLHGDAEAAIKNLRQLTRTWKLATAEQRSITSAIRLAPEIARAEELPWSQLQPILIDRDIEVIMRVAAAISDEGAGVRHAFSQLRRAGESLDPPPLLTGDDLIASGISAGPQFRTWLSEIRRRQLDGEMETSAEALDWVLREATR